MENVTSDEIILLRKLFISYGKIFYDEKIHSKTLISDLKREPENLKGLNNIYDVLLYNGLDPM